MASKKAMFFTTEFTEVTEKGLNLGKSYGYYEGDVFTAEVAEFAEEGLIPGESTVTIKAMFFTTACHGVAESEDGRLRGHRERLESE